MGSRRKDESPSVHPPPPFLQCHSCTQATPKPFGRFHFLLVRGFYPFPFWAHPWTKPSHSTYRPPRVLFHPPPLVDGTSFICASHDRLAILRASQTGDWQATLEGHGGAVWSSKMDRTGSLAATAGADCAARLWSLTSSQGPHALTSQVNTSRFKHEFVHKSVVRTVEFSPVSGPPFHTRLSVP